MSSDIKHSRVAKDTPAVKGKAMSARKKARLKRLRRKRQIRNSLIIVAAIAIICIIIFVVFGNNNDDVSVTPTAANTIVNESVTYTPTPTPTQLPTVADIPTATPEPTATPVPTPAPTPVDLEYPYFIQIDKSKQVITVYTIGEEGYYDLVVKQFICSTGKYDKMENGMYRIEAQYRWKQMGNGSYAQYASRISGPYLFHSCVYYSEKINQLKQYYYTHLGQNVSSGCVRMNCGDAYWIYTNCKVGTPIQVIASGDYDQALIDSLWHPDLININYDPTDPECPAKYAVTPSPDTTPDPTPALGVTPAPTPKWTVHPELQAWGY